MKRERLFTSTYTAFQGQPFYIRNILKLSKLSAAISRHYKLLQMHLKYALYDIDINAFKEAEKKLISSFLYTVIN